MQNVGLQSGRPGGDFENTCCVLLGKLELFLISFRNQCLLSRTRRRQAREQTGKMADHLEGLSSDDEETSTDITNFNLEKGQPCVLK